MTLVRSAVLGSMAAAFLTSILPSQVQWQPLGNQGGPGLNTSGYAWDAIRNQLIVFGGDDATGTVFDSTWAWNGSNWSPRNAGSRPVGRARPTMAFDEANGNIVLFGGWAGTAAPNTFFADTWVWNGFSWSQRSPATVPTARSGAWAFFDRTRNKVVMFGGFGTNNTDFNDTWEWDGTNWAPITGAGTPSARGAHRIVYDESNDTALLYGGFNRTLGRTIDDCSIWNGSSWQNYVGPRPQRLCDQATAYDPERQRIVLFGGLFINGGTINELGDTWEWENSTWIQRSPGAGPAARANAFMIWDASQRCISMASGATAAGVQSDAWKFTPVNQASTTQYGVGCTNSVGTVSTLSATSLPYLGDTLRLRVDNIPPSVNNVFFALGISDQTWSPLVNLPFDLTLLGANGCTLYSSIATSVGATTTAGTAGIDLTLGNSPSLIQVPWYSTVVVPDLAVARPLPISLSNAIRIEIGAK